MRSLSFLFYMLGGAVISCSLLFGVSSRLDRPRQVPVADVVAIARTSVEPPCTVEHRLPPQRRAAPVEVAPAVPEVQVRRSHSSSCGCGGTRVNRVRAEEATLSADALLEGLPEGYKFGASVELKGMTLKSVLGPSHENSYLTLDEAMASELCTVSEGSGGLNVQNHSDKPIFCMAGDLMLGGHQDRILAENIVVGPRSSVTAPVFCVEAGRSCADPRDGEAGSRGEFFKDEHRGQVDLSVKRAAIQSISQNDVWAEVARCNADLNCSCVKETGTFRNIYDDKNTAQMIERNVVSASTLGARGVVGYAAFVDGRLVALELFDSADLCAKLSAKLLRGYIITGLSGGYSTGKCFPVPAHAMVADHEESPGVGEKGDSSASAVLASAREKSVQAMETSPSTRTQIRREYRADSVRYFCTDTTTGRRVHFSLMRR